MPFIDELIKYNSVSIVGMEKNTGKTECLNYILRRLKGSTHRLAITSIGLDGEGLDQVTNTHKPEITLDTDNLFITTETHYRAKKLDANILDLSSKHTALGRLVTAQALKPGKIIIAGPTDTLWLKQLIEAMDNYRVDTTLVDGALSRKSIGSPAITEAMILTTGAALSANINSLVSQTTFVQELINLPKWESEQNEALLSISKGIWALDNENKWHDLQIESAFLLESNKEKLFDFGHTLFVSGAVTSGMLNFLRLQDGITKTKLIVRDFSRVFADKESYIAFLRSGGQINVLLQTKLIAICVNPVSPQGYLLDSEMLINSLKEKSNVPVYDIFNV